MLTSRPGSRLGDWIRPSLVCSAIVVSRCEPGENMQYGLLSGWCEEGEVRIGQK